jgi:hypothetical protein
MPVSVFSFVPHNRLAVQQYRSLGLLASIGHAQGVPLPFDTGI